MSAYNYKKISLLVDRVKERDAQAFADLYGMSYQKVYYLALSLLRDTQLAEDAVQETYIRVFNSISSLHDNRMFIAWLNKITYSVCMRILSGRRIDSDLDEIEEKVTDSNMDQDPLISTVKNESRRTLMKEILALPDLYKAVILMKFYENLSIDEISEALDIPPGTVKSRIHTAKGILKKNISKKGDDLK